jgi:hypothetical protein
MYYILQIKWDYKIKICPHGTKLQCMIHLPRDQLQSAHLPAIVGYAEYPAESRACAWEWCAVAWSWWSRAAAAALWLAAPQGSGTAPLLYWWDAVTCGGSLVVGGNRRPPYCAAMLWWWWYSWTALEIEFICSFRSSKKLNSVASVRERSISTEQTPLVGEVTDNFCGYRVSRGQRKGSLRP